MGISYDKMLKLFQERGITSYTMRKEKSSVRQLGRRFMRAETLTQKVWVPYVGFWTASRGIYWNM